MSTRPKYAHTVTLPTKMRTDALQEALPHQIEQKYKCRSTVMYIANTHVTTHVGTDPSLGRGRFSHADTAGSAAAGLKCTPSHPCRR